jgi:prepilin-type N-terminal cleavage/methylation domain-containing protein/prepilin-type processing-associated H-X9-DG protein
LRRGFTLIELLVAIGVIGLLISLLLPAVQQARGTARKTACRNNLRQIGLAVMNQESTHRHFPSNGWGYLWIGEPGRGVDPRQPGGWIYNVLAEVEQAPLRDLGAGLSGPARRAALAELSRTPLELFKCAERPGNAVGPANPMITPFNCDWQPNVESMYSGVDLDLNRWTIETPLWDGDGQAERSFGSAHAHGCHFVYCDGSVRQVSYDVDGEVHRAAGNRRDGAP